MGGGAWPFLVGGVICLVNSVNERDLNLLNSHAHPAISKNLCGSIASPVGGTRALLLGFGRGLCRRSDGWTRFLEGLPALSRRKFEAITGL